MSAPSCAARPPGRRLRRAVHPRPGAPPSRRRRPTGRDGPPNGVSATEVVGSLSTAAVEGALADGRAKPDSLVGQVGGLLAPPLPTVGIGQPLSVARASVGAGHDAALVLLDGRAVALVHRTELVEHPGR
ncbi:hypothetical protein [Streptomyces sp. CB01881]|uniref:hypothetical protein n=1 Tax=Streptomyces sp. CB01881 TaxID=2078691 RepID=UPI0011DFB02F|nr:hypothetical protein [Streptomyces sp. CB01881]TYC69541.1 hypothetical protein EH183_35965 [Streptomyces sp. CB01881]